MSNFVVFAAWSSSRSGFLSDSRVFDPNPRATTLTDEDNTLSLNETTAFTYVGIPSGPNDDIGPYDMYQFSITGGGQAIWMAGNGQSGGLVIPYDQAAYDVFRSGASYSIASGAGVSSVAYSSFFVPPPPNNPPALGGTPSNQAVTEDLTTAIDLSAYNVSDADADAITLTLAVTSGSIASLSGNGTTSGVTVANSGTTSMTLQGAAADLNTFLNNTANIRFTPPSDANGSITLTVTPNDGTDNGTADTVTLNITPVNDDPTATGVPASVTTTEDTQSNIDLSAISFADIDSASITVTLTASAGTFATPADGAGVGGGVTETLVSATTVTLVGAPADISTYLDTASNLRYTPPTDAAGTSQATITVTANDGDGSGNVAMGTVQVNVTAVNDAPVLTGLDATPNVLENAAAQILDGNVTVADAELGALNGGAGDFSGAVLTIARNGGTNPDDAFSIATGGNLTVAGGTISAGGNAIASFDTSTGGQVVVTFGNNGTAPTTALVNEVLQAIRYSNQSDDPAASVTLDWSFSDGNSGNAQGSGDNPGVATGSVTVSVTNVNDAPTLTATGQNPTFVEGPAVSAVDLFSAVSVDPVETLNGNDRITGLTLTVTNLADGADEILSLDGSDVALTNGNSVATATNGLSVAVSVVGTTATVSFTGASLTQAQMQTLVDGLTYRNASDDPGTAANRVITLTQISDDGGTLNGGQNTTSLAVASTVSVTGVNDAPVIGNAFGETSTVMAGAGPVNVAGLDDVSVSNADSADYDGGTLTLAQATGTTNGSWGLDGTTAASGGDPAFAAGETVTVGGISIGTVDVTDDGQGGNDLAISLNGNATSPAVATLFAALTYDAPSGLGARSFTLTLDDADGTANGGDADVSGAFTINVTPNPPVIAGLNSDAVTFTEGDTAVALDAGGNASVTDADSTEFDGGALTVAYQTGQQAEDRLAFDTSGTVSLSAGMTAGSIVSVGGTAVGTLQASATGGASEDLTVSLNVNATAPRISTLLQALEYGNTGGDVPTAGDRTLAISINDGDGATSVASFVTVTVAAVNDAPVIGGTPTDPTIDDTGSATPFSGLSVADAEDDGGTIDISYTAGHGVLSGTGLSGTAGSYSLAGADAAEITSRLQALVFTPEQNIVAPGETTPTSFSLTPNDGTEDGAAFTTATVTARSVNDAPVIGGFVAAQSVDDAATLAPFAAATVSDPDTAQTVVVTVSLDHAAKGTFSGASLAASGFVQSAAGVYTLSDASAPDAQAALRALVFDPADNRVAPGTMETTAFTVAVDDGVAAPVVDTATTVLSTSLNDAPLIGGTAAAQPVTDKATVAPFAAVTIADVDPGQTLSATIVLDDAAKGVFTAASLTNAGFTETSAGTWTLASGTSPAALQSALRALVFEPVENRITPGQTEAATFTLSVSDGIASTTDTETNVVISPVNDAASISGDTTATIGEDATPSSISGALTATDPDNTDNSFQPVTTAQSSDGGFGTFTVTAAGAWTYTLDTGAAQSLGAGDTAIDTFTVRTEDGTAQPVSISISGADDPSVVSGRTNGSLAEGDPGDEGSTSGTLVITDPDADDTPRFGDQSSTPGENGFGSFGMAGGTWTYTLNQGAVQNLGDGESVTDSTTFTATDGTRQSVSVTIEGENDAPSFSRPAAETTPADGRTLSVSLFDGARDAEGDPLTVSAFSIESDRRGEVGFTLNAAGTLLIQTAQFVDLGSGQSETLTLSYTLSDGSSSTTASREIIVTGVNAAPIAVDDEFFLRASSEGLVGNLLLQNGSDPDRDPDGDALRLVSLAGTAVPANGQTSIALSSGDTVNVDASGRFFFEPGSRDGMENRTVSFAYEISDPSGARDTATASIEIAPAPMGSGSQTWHFGSSVLQEDETVEDFGPGGALVIAVPSEELGVVEIAETELGFVIGIDSDGDGAADSSILVRGEIDGGGFLTSTQGNGAGQRVSLEYALDAPVLAEALAVVDGVVNGVTSTAYLTGNGERVPVVRFDESTAAQNNAVGTYVVAADGTIEDVRIVFGNTNATDAGATVSLAPLETGEMLGVFLVADGAALSGVSALEFVRDDGLTPASAFENLPPILLADGQAVELDVFHAFSGLNEGGHRMVWSGYDPQTGGLSIGFEDVDLAQSDRDYNDVLIGITVASPEMM